MKHHTTYLITIILLFVSVLFCASAKTQDNFIETSGDVMQFVLPAAALGSTLIYKDGSKPGWQFAKTYVSAMVITHSFKRIINKERPNGGKHAFPSGHTSSAFAGAAFIQKRYGWKWGIPSFALASYTGWTRIDSQHHDVWDVIGGATVGILSAYIFTEAYDKNELSVTLDKSEHGLSLSVSLRL